MSGETFPKYQSTGGRQLTPERLKFFRLSDFKDASVLDLGCNEGLFEEFARQHGAHDYLGVDSDPSFEREAVLIRDLNDPASMLSLYQKFDVVLVLALTHWLENPEMFAATVENMTKKVIYYEGHQKEFVEDNFEKLFKSPAFRWEYLGETPVGRPFYRGERI